MDSTNQTADKTTPYSTLKTEFVANVRSQFSGLTTEIADRNQRIMRNDNFVYGDFIRRSLDIPAGHDFTEVNWLRRAVEIHKNTFMGRDFTVSSTYIINDLSSTTDDASRQRLELENQKRKQYAESRMDMIKAIKRDNNGGALWETLAENASAIGDVALMQYWDDDEKKVCQVQIENIENLYCLWNRDDFRTIDAYAYIYQVSKQEAISYYNAPDDVATSPLGNPLEAISNGNVSGTAFNGVSSQPMVTIMDVTGKLQGWRTKKGVIERCEIGEETPFSAKIIGNDVTQLIDDEKKMPKYYRLPNKLRRKRPWGLSDITESAIHINLAYIEALSDWRTVSAKVNFPKFKAIGFGEDTTMPKFKKRKVQMLPLSEGQDLEELQMGSSDGVDWGRQLDQLEGLFLRETAIAPVLFNDPSVTLNSNQALTTSMKPTTDVSEAKKQLWAPIMEQIYRDALELTAQNMTSVAEAITGDTNWSLKIMWPSVTDIDDPSYVTMQLNKFNAGLMSAQSFQESLGGTKEEIDRIREEMNDPITAAMLAHNLQGVAQKAIYEFMGMPPWGYITPKVSLRGDLAPAEVGNMAHNYQWDQGPYGPSIGPQGNAGQTANDNSINTGYLSGAQPGATANYQGPQAGQQAGQMTTPGQNQPGQQPMSQPGTGATGATAGGALDQANQNAGN